MAQKLKNIHYFKILRTIIAILGIIYSFIVGNWVKKSNKKNLLQNLFPLLVIALVFTILNVCSILYNGFHIIKQKKQEKKLKDKKKKDKKKKDKKNKKEQVLLQNRLEQMKNMKQELEKLEEDTRAKLQNLKDKGVETELSQLEAELNNCRELNREVAGNYNKLNDAVVNDLSKVERGALGDVWYEVLKAQAELSKAMDNVTSKLHDLEAELEKELNKKRLDKKKKKKKKEKEKEKTKVKKENKKETVIDSDEKDKKEKIVIDSSDENIKKEKQEQEKQERLKKINDMTQELNELTQEIEVLLKNLKNLKDKEEEVKLEAELQKYMLKKVNVIKKHDNLYNALNAELGAIDNALYNALKNPKKAMFDALNAFLYVMMDVEYELERRNEKEKKEKKEKKDKKKKNKKNKKKNKKKESFTSSEEDEEVKKKNKKDKKDKKDKNKKKNKKKESFTSSEDEEEVDNKEKKKDKKKK
jgi:hypothetical protein